MRRHHPDLEHIRSVVPRRAAQEAAEELCAGGIQQRRPIARRPGEVEVEAVVHPAR
ncbi:MAG TPA: hypothetical protein VL100_02160 [Croceibacterium sp.]|nr:hypothetical protein [Croceibacterium sp.]